MKDTEINDGSYFFHLYFTFRKYAYIVGIFGYLNESHIENRILDDWLPYS